VVLFGYGFWGLVGAFLFWVGGHLFSALGCGSPLFLCSLLRVFVSRIFLNVPRGGEGFRCGRFWMRSWVVFAVSIRFSPVCFSMFDFYHLHSFVCFTDCRI